MRRELATTLAVGLVVLAIDVHGAARAAFVGDSAELVTAVHVLGIPHPSGYPLYVLLGKLWTLLVPVGSVAFRLSLFSATCTAGACALLHRAALVAGASRLAALLAPLLAAFAPSIWSQATVQRVYGLNLLFVAGAALLALRWWRDGRDGLLVAALAACGLGASNHLSMAVQALATVTFAVTVRPALLRRPRALLAGAAAFAAGLLPYAWLPARSAADPLLDWGDPETLDRFLKVITRRHYWGRSYVESPGDLVTALADFVASVPGEITLVGALLAVLGLALGARRRGPALLALLVGGGSALVVCLHGSADDIFVWHRYHAPSYAMAALAAALGATSLLARVAARVRWRWTAPALGVALLTLPASLAVDGWTRLDRSDHRLAEDFAEELLATLPPGAHLIASDDNVLFPLLHARFVLGRRADVELVAQGLGDVKPPTLRFDPMREPTYFTHWSGTRQPGVSLVPVGLALRAWPAEAPLPPLPALPETLDGEDHPSARADSMSRRLVGHFHFALASTWAARGDERRAASHLQRAREAAPDDAPLAQNIGMLLATEGRFDLAEIEVARALAVARATHRREVERSAEAALQAVRAERTRLDALIAELATRPNVTGARDAAARHEALATLLDLRGETTAARGQRLLADEARTETDR